MINVACNNLCGRYKADIDRRLFSKGIGIYMQGAIRCNTCNIFLKDEGIVENKYGNKLCRCCKFRVTSKPRRTIAKNKLLKKKELNEELLRSVIYG